MGDHFTFTLRVGQEVTRADLLALGEAVRRWNRAVDERDRYRDAIERALRMMGDTRAHESASRSTWCNSHGGGWHAPTMGTRYIDAEGILRAALKEADDA